MFQGMTVGSSDPWKNRYSVAELRSAAPRVTQSRPVMLYEPPSVYRCWPVPGCAVMSPAARKLFHVPGAPGLTPTVANSPCRARSDLEVTRHPAMAAEARFLSGEVHAVFIDESRGRQSWQQEHADQGDHEQSEYLLPHGSSLMVRLTSGRAGGTSLIGSLDECRREAGGRRHKEGTPTDGHAARGHGFVCRTAPPSEAGPHRSLPATLAAYPRVKALVTQDTRPESGLGCPPDGKARAAARTAGAAERRDAGPLRLDARHPPARPLRPSRRRSRLAASRAG